MAIFRWGYMFGREMDAWNSGNLRLRHLREREREKRGLLLLSRLLLGSRLNGDSGFSGRIEFLED